MDRRAFYRLVAALLATFGSSEALLNAVAGAMRSHRISPTVPIVPPLDAIAPLLSDDDLLGQIYQAINAPVLESAYRTTARTGRKFTPREIPAVTQLFTPKWVIEFLLANTLGQVGQEMHPDSTLHERPARDLSLPSNSTGGMPVQLKDLRICDPACGTMNFGLVAIDMLREMYREEISHAGEPGWPTEPSCPEAEIDIHIVQRNLIGFDIDPIALGLARQSLEIKIGKPIEPGRHRLRQCNTLFDGKLDGDFDIIVTNPPYLSARNLDPKIVRRLKKKYPSAWRDLYACFMLKSLQLLRPGGRLGILSMHSFMFTGAFEALRREIQSHADIQTVAHFGPGLFDIGNPGTLQTAAVVLQRKPAANQPATFFQLTAETDKRSALARAIQSSKHFQLTQTELASFPRSAWMYWISPAIRRAFATLPKLGDIAPPRQGLATTDNRRFVRYWWEVEPPNFTGPRDKWKPYAKGGRFRRWYEAARHRVNWQDDGREIKQAIVDRYPYLNGQWQWVAKNSAWYGRGGITYSYLTSGSFSARRLEPGSIFDVAGSSLFPDDPLPILGILNSSIAGQLLAAINPTVNFQVGDLRQLPLPLSFPPELREEVARAIDCTRALDRHDETSPDFLAPEPFGQNENVSHEQRIALARAERSINEIAARLYGVQMEKGSPAEHRPPHLELAKRWISYALGIWLGRWEQSAMGSVAILSPLDSCLRRDLERILFEKAGEHAVAAIIRSIGSLDQFLARDFLPWHNLLYRARPIFWGFTGNGKTVAIHCPTADYSTVDEAFRRIGETLPPGWQRWKDDGIQINLAPLSQFIADRKLRKLLTELNMELDSGEYSFSETAKWLESQNSAGKKMK